jgi:hypothetical protein
LAPAAAPRAAEALCIRIFLSRNLLRHAGISFSRLPSIASMAVEKKIPIPLRWFPPTLPVKITGPISFRM